MNAVIHGNDALGWALTADGPRKGSGPRRLPKGRYSAESYTETVVPLSDRLVAVARRILGDDVQAWDAVQDALIGLWTADEIPANPRAWLTRAVVLRSLHLARSRARRRRHESRACDRRAEASDRDEPSRRLEHHDLAKTLDELLGSIPGEYREVVHLRTAERMDYAAIAEALKIPIGTVRSRLSRTRRLLRDSLSGPSPDFS